MDLVGGALTLDDLQRLHAGGRSAAHRRRLARERIRASAAVVSAPPPAPRRSTASTPASASWPTTRIDADRARAAAAQPDPLAQRRRRRAAERRPVVRLMLALKAASLARGHSGVREAIVDALLAVHNAGLVPFMPSQGFGRRVGRPGAAGAPVAGADGRRRGASTADRRPAAARAAPASRRSRSPPRKAWRCSTARRSRPRWRSHALFSFEPVLEAALVVGALTVDAARGSDGPFDPRIHALRGQPGQIDVAATTARCSRAARSAARTCRATTACRIRTACAASRR